MRFAVRRFSKAIVIGVLGCAAALLIACGDRNGLLPGDQASGLNSALDGVAVACSSGRVAAAQDAARQFQQRVDALSAQTVDRRLIRDLKEGASTLEQLVPGTCEKVTETVPTIETPAETTPSTTPTTPTTPETTPTTPSTTPTTPETGGGETTPPDTGGGTTTPDTGGNTTPGTGGDSGGDQQFQPDVNQGNPGGALAPGQGGAP